MDGEPTGHPAQQQDSKEEKRADIEQSVALVALRGFRLARDDEQLASVQEHRVDLHHEGQGGVRHVLSGRHSNGEAENDEEVVDEQLVGRALAVVEQHVQGVVDEVADGEGDEGVG